MRRLLTAGLLFVTLMAVTTGCVPDEVDQETDASDTITVVTGPAPFTLMPYSELVSARQVGSLVFSGLVRPDVDGEPVADLATEVPTVENGGLSAGADEATYAIRDDARWHDGEPITAADAVFTWELMRDGLIADRPTDAARIKSVEAVDERTVRVVFAGPSADLAFRFMPFVLPEHLLGESPDPLSDPYWLAPVGSGPYRVAEREGEALVKLEPVAGGEPLQVVFARSAADARQAFDGTDASVWLGAPVDAAGASEYVSAAPSPTWTGFVFNAAQDRATSDAAARDILGRTISAETTASVGPWAQTPAGSPITTEAAAAELDAAGWAISGDGIRAKDGRRLTVVLATRDFYDDAERERLTAIRDMWISMGVDAELTAGAEHRYGGFHESSEIGRGTFDVAWTEFNADDRTIPGLLAYGDAPSFTVPFGENLTRTEDAALDAAVRTYLLADDPTQLLAAREAVGTELDRLDVIVWDSQLENRALARAVSGVAVPGDPAWSLLGAETWEIDR